MSNWKAIQEEIIESGNVFDVVRRRHLAKLHKYTERNVIAYYSGWLSNEPSVDASIIDDDKNGFMMCIHGLNKKQGLDLMILRKNHKQSLEQKKNIEQHHDPY